MRQMVFYKSTADNGSSSIRTSDLVFNLAKQYLRNAARDPCHWHRPLDCRKKDAAEALAGAESARNRVYLRCPRYGLPRGNENDGEERGDRREAPKDLHGSQAVPPEQLDPRDNDSGTAHDHVKRSKGLLLAGPRSVRSGTPGRP